MTATSGTSSPKTYKGIRGVISSPVSPGGTSRCNSPAGPPSGLFGQVPVPARRSRPPVKKRAALRAKAATLSRILTRRGHSSAVSVDTHGMPTVVISGRSSTDSSGSPEFTLRWKYSDTMFGGPIYRLRASARRTGDRDYGSWPTPNACDATRGSPETDAAKRARKAHTGRSLIDVASLAAWASLAAMDGRSDRCRGNRGELRGRKGHPLRGQVLGASTTSSGVTSGPAGGAGRRGALNPEHARAIVPQVAAKFIADCLERERS